MARQNAPLVGFLAVALALMLAVYWYYAPDADAISAVSITGAEASEEAAALERDALARPIAKSVPDQPVTQRLAQSPPPTKVGIIAGHRNNDSGTVCEDGLTEVQITTVVAQQLAAALQADSVQAETLDEFDDRLIGYGASALVSIHVDSCAFVNDLATGYKVSGSAITDSSALSICLQQAYGRVTGLPYHPHSITPHMSDYHAFREIASGTPAVIIELGFLNLDREFLINNQELVVQGLVEGVDCFLAQR
ncbi:MAG: N-acetylmuramoyl-L-alanine amidase [Candidatus Promineifilaceae bacterium]